MAASTESEKKNKLSEPTLKNYENYKGETCPSCGNDYLYTNDSDKFDEIMRYDCLGCGYAFHEDEQGKEYRKGKNKKDKDRNPWNEGILVFFAMLAVILLINLDRNSRPLVDESQQSTTQINRQI